MPFAEHLRITALGRLGSNSGERFSYGVAMGKVSGDGIGNLFDPGRETWADIAADVRKFHTAPFGPINSRAVLEEVKIAHIGPDGKYLADPIIVNVVDAPGSAGEDTGTPPQAALAISLVTARRGASGKGRFYLPMPRAILAPDTLLMSPDNANDIRSVCKTFLDDLNNQSGADVLDLEVVVASSKGYNSKVTGVRVGRAIDTVRSRRRNLPENYSAVAALA